MAGMTLFMRLRIAKLIFQNAQATLIGNGTIDGSVAAGSFYWSLHTADPGEAGTQATSEIAYTGYARVATARSAAGFAVNALTAAISNAVAITWGTNTAGTPTATHWGLGTSVSGAGKLLMSGPLGASFVMSPTTNSIPSAGIGSLSSTWA